MHGSCRRPAVRRQIIKLGLIDDNWMTEKGAVAPNPETLQEIRDEVADVFKAVLYLAQRVSTM